MKIKALLILGAVFLSLLFPVQRVFTNALQPPGGRTGCTEPPTETTCGVSTCHNTTPNTGGGSLVVTYSDSTLHYVPGQTYDMTVTTSEAGKVKFGFEITITDGNGDSVGTFIIPTGVTNISTPLGGINHRKYLGHKSANSNNTWSFQWKAPAIDKGQLCFFLASNCANGNGQSSGDHIYTTSLCIDPASATGIFSPEISKNEFSIQSILHNHLTLRYYQPAGDRVVIRIYDVNGILIQTLFDENEAEGWQIHSFSLNQSLSNGLYLIQYTSGIADVAKKIFIHK